MPIHVSSELPVAQERTGALRTASAPAFYFDSTTRDQISGQGRQLATVIRDRGERAVVERQITVRRGTSTTFASHAHFASHAGGTSRFFTGCAAFTHWLTSASASTRFAARAGVTHPAGTARGWLVLLVAAAALKGRKAEHDRSDQRDCERIFLEQGHHFTSQ
jgi:hypothetical protein